MKKDNFLDNDVSKKEKQRKKIKIILFLGVFIIVLPYFCFKFLTLYKNPSNTYLVTNGELKQEESREGYIVREEVIVEGTLSGKEMSKIKQEGERVAKGDTVFRYASQQENELKKQIAQIDEEIQKLLEENDTIFLSDKKMLEAQMTEEMNKVYEINNLRKIQEYKNNINTYLSKKARIIGEYTPSNSYLKQLISDRSSYEEQLNTVSEDIKAPVAGMTSYRVDELESVLQVDDFSKLNKEFLENLHLESGRNIASSNEKGKIVNNYYCYLIFNSDSEESKSVKVGDMLKIKIDDEEISAVIHFIIEEEDKSRTITLKLKNDTEKLLEYRKISFDLAWWSIDGFRVPNSSIIEENNIKYVIRNRNGYLNKMAVKVLKQGEEYSIVSGYTKNELKELGLTEEEIDNLRTITLYDRIELKPTK